MANKKRRLSVSSSTLDDVSRSATPAIEASSVPPEGLDDPVQKHGVDLRKGADSNRTGRSKGGKGKGKDKALSYEFRMSWPPYFESVRRIKFWLISRL